MANTTPIDKTIADILLIIYAVKKSFQRIFDAPAY